MNTSLMLVIVLAYFLLLLGIAWVTSRKSNNESFFIGNRNSKWWLVAFGMIGTSLSGVTFVSVPGTVGDFTSATASAFKGLGYFQVVIGYFLGYFIVSYVLLPLYYKLQLTSIYVYLRQRFGNVSYKTGAMFFIISRTIGATARLYLVINILQIFILDALGVPFIVTTLIILLMILLYTYEGGVKTIVYTDTLQTACMLMGLIVCVWFIIKSMNLPLGSAIAELRDYQYTDLWNMDFKSKGFFLKQILGGMFITISMTGLDQEMMQKNISVKTLGGSQKNMLTFSIVMMLVNFLFLFLGGLVYLYMMQQGGVYDGHAFIDPTTGANIIGDNIFPTAALHFMPQSISIIFIIALISALFPSADGALTALTSSFCIDILGVGKKNDAEAAVTDIHKEARTKRIRQIVHITFSLVFLVCILIFKWIDDKSIIGIILEVAGYTYGPLLGLFAFGLLSKRVLVKQKLVPFICLLAPIICYALSSYSTQLFNGYAIGIELLVINAALVYAMLFIISKPPLTADSR